MIKILLFLALLCGGSAASESLLPADLQAEFTKAWPKNRVIHIVFHGHSVPAGYHKTPDVRTFESYPHLVMVELKRRYSLAVMNGIVTAIGGENSASGAARFDKDVLTHRPDVVFIDYALNDRGLPVDKMEEAWRSMIRAAKKQGVTVVLITPTGDMKSDWKNPEDPLQIRAQVIRKLAGEENVLLADVTAAWRKELESGTDQASLMSQGNHPNLKGHQLATKAICRVFGEAAP